MNESGVIVPDTSYPITIYDKLGPIVRSGAMPVPVNKALLECRHAHLFTYAILYPATSVKSSDTASSVPSLLLPRAFAPAGSSAWNDGASDLPKPAPYYHSVFSS